MSSSGCPLCDESAHRILPFHYLWRDDRFDLAACRSCGHVSLRPSPTPEQIASFYDDDYFESGLHGLDREDATYVERADAARDETIRFVKTELLPHRPGARSIFEIGAATGHLLDAARATGIERQGGVEISSGAAAHARESFGFDLIRDNVDRIDPATLEPGWDLVYAGDVMEHVRDPGRFVDTLGHLVADDGAVVVRVPATFELISTRLASAGLSMLGKSMRLPDAPYHLHEYRSGILKALFSKRFASVEVRNDIVPPTRLNLKGLRPQYLLKLVLHVFNYPITKMFGVWGDRFTVVARQPRRET